jgi:hypothetical protein
MPNFAQFLADAARKGEAVNILFEERLFDLVGVLHKITDALTAEGIPHELIGGLAVFVHVEEADPTHSTLTRDVDLMVRERTLLASSWLPQKRASGSAPLREWTCCCMARRIPP